MESNRYYNSIEGAAKLPDRDLVELFVYYLTVELGLDGCSALDVSGCFTDCDLSPPKRIAQYLSEGLSSKPQRYLKVQNGYKLERNRREAISEKLGPQRVVVQTSFELRSIEARMKDGPQKGFLKETIDCFEAGANRATIVMCWILTIDHLFDLILKRHLPAFNSELSKVTDKRVKVSSITNRDDFSDIPEGKFIELLRAASIISNDVRKILDTKLGVRTCIGSRFWGSDQEKQGDRLCGGPNRERRAQISDLALLWQISA